MAEADPVNIPMIIEAIRELAERNTMTEQTVAEQKIIVQQLTARVAELEGAKHTEPSQGTTAPKATTSKRKSDSDSDSATKSPIKPEPVKKKQKQSSAVSDVDDDGQKFFSLGGEKRCTLKQFRGVKYVDIREYYVAGGDTKPGKKGISLNVDAFERLIPCLGAAAQHLGVAWSGTQTAAKGDKDDDGQTFYQLGNEKRCTLKQFRGVKYVDIREYYVKAGDAKPGKKGISLNADTFERFLPVVGAAAEFLGATYSE